MNTRTTIRRKIATTALLPARPQKLNRADDGNLVAFANGLSQQHEADTDAHSRRHIGQVFTPPTVCHFMAECLGAIGHSYKLLDAGAGTGSLTAAVCDRIIGGGEPIELTAVLFETDATVLPFLQRAMEECRRRMQRAGHGFDFDIREDDFVLARPQLSLFENGDSPAFDGVVMNPPYFKIAKDSKHARIMADIVHGQPNIYALFMAVGAQMLRPGGKFVAITPRSYCNGLYFREFRRWYLSRMDLDQLHLFESRTSTFSESAVLQESLITVASRRNGGRAGSSNIAVTKSTGRDLVGICKRQYPEDVIVDDSGGDLTIRIPTDAIDAEVVQVVKTWPAKFSAGGLRISTGPVVSFRAREYLLSDTIEPDAIPLLSIHNVRLFETVWPLERGDKPIAFRACPETRSQILPSRNYVLLRRFSAKEETRRLVASCYFPTAADRRRSVALENHINYVYLAERELTQTEAVGVASLLNSTLLDRYFRVLSGNTQVNATEIRAMPFPGLETLARIGNRVQKLGAFPRYEIDQIVLDELGINGSISRELLGVKL